MDFDLEELAAIIEQLDKTEFTDFSFEKGDVRIRVKRGGALADDDGATAEPPHATSQGPHPPSAGSGKVPDVQRRGPAPSASRPGSPTLAVHPPAPQPTTPDADLDVVRAPMLGHFYRSPKPGEPPFIALGDSVEADATVCIIEVMKLMNSVPARVAGEIVEIYADDGQLVEFDQPLFGVRAASSGVQAAS